LVVEALESRRLFSQTVASIIPNPNLVPLPEIFSPPVEISTGITGEYFAGDQFNTPTVIRLDDRINFNWTSGRPDQDIPKGVFSAQWVGQIQPASTATYTFDANSNGATSVIVNGVTVVSKVTSADATTASGTIALTAGQKYSIIVQYVSRGAGTAKMQLLWSSPAMAKTLVPASVLYPTAESLPTNTALVGNYYEGDNFNKLLMTRADSSINFNWGEGVPDLAIPQDTPFSAIWTGEITAPATGKYTFESITDDGVRLFVNGVEIIKDWNVHSAQSDLGKITLTAGQTYSIKMEYFQDGAGHTSAKLLWALPGQGRVERFVHFITPGPAAPQNLAVTPFSSTQLNISWGDVADETGFILERAPLGGQAFAPTATLAQGITNYSDTGLTPATTYEYEVIATDAAGSSNPSTVATGTTDPGPVTATATTSGTSATISFTTPGTPTSYTIQRSPNGTTGFTSVGTATASPFTDTGLSAATTYYYQVTATNAVGSSAPSNVVSVTTVPVAPPDLTATTASATLINLTWTDVPGETAFIVQESPDGSTNWTQIGTTAMGVTSFAAAGLTPATPYFFRVFAVDAGGISAASNTATATTSPANPPYAGLTTIFGLTGTGFVYSIDTTTGAATQIGTLSYGTNAAARDNYSGNFYYIEDDTSTPSISTWNPNDGVNTLVDASIQLSGPTGQAAFRSDGDLFLTTDTGNLYEVDTDNGVVTPNGNIHANGTSLATNDGDIAFAPNETMFIETNSELYSVSSSAIDAAFNSSSIITATDIGPTNSPNLQIAFGQNGVLFGTDANGQLYSLNTSTGAATAIGAASGVNMGDLASVPLYADLSTTQTASTFVRGSAGTYSLTVNNAGPDTTVGPITLVDTLPTGVSYVGGVGTGWTFSVSGQTVTMTYPINLAAGTSAPPVTLNVNVLPSAAATVTNSVTVSSTEFTTNTADNNGSLVTPVSG